MPWRLGLSVLSETWPVRWTWQCYPAQKAWLLVYPNRTHQHPYSQTPLTGCRIKLLSSHLRSLFKGLKHFCRFGQFFHTSLLHLSVLPSSLTNSISTPFELHLYKNLWVSSRKKVKVRRRKCEECNYDIASVWCCPRNKSVVHSHLRTEQPSLLPHFCPATCKAGQAAAKMRGI